MDVHWDGHILRVELLISKLEVNFRKVHLTTKGYYLPIDIIQRIEIEKQFD